MTIFALPANRAYPWTGNVGIPGGIPDSTAKTVYTTVTTHTIAAIESAWNACPDNQVVQLEAATYTGSSQMDIRGSGVGIVLRGAGVGQTILRWTNYSESAVKFGLSYDTGPFTTEANLSQNAVKGEYTVILASVPSWVTVGGLLTIDEIDQTAYADGSNGFNQRTLNTGEERNISHMLRVTDKTATTITFEVPLFWSWLTSRTAQISQPGYNPATTTPPTLCGFEGFTMDLSAVAASTDPHPWHVYCVDRCYWKDVEISDMPGGRAWLVYQAYRCEWQRNYVHDASNYAGGQGYGVDLNNSSCHNLVHDNIFRNLHINGTTIRYGSSCNVFAYNYGKAEANASAQTACMSHHGCSSQFNLFEGNYTNDKVLGDWTHGSSCFNVCFRNYAEGRGWGTGDATAVSIEYYNRYWSIIGNILGVNGLHNKYVSHSGDTSAGSQGNIFKVGGEVNINSDYSPADAYSETSGAAILLHGNYDYVNDAQTFSANYAAHDMPSSLYLAAKPTYFGSLTWPPLDPTNPSGAASAAVIPAGYRYINGTDPPSGGSPPTGTPVLSVR